MNSLTEIIDQFPYAGLLILLIMGGIGFPFPEDTTLILCGFLIFNDVIRPVPALLVVYCGVLSTDVFLYFVGKKYGRMIVTHRRFRKIISQERLSALEDRFNKRGVLVVLVGRHLIGLRAQIFIVAGVVKMSFAKFLVADAVSSLFTIALMVGAGYIGGNSLEIVKKDISRVEHAAIFVLVAGLALFFLFRYIRSIRKGR